MPRGWENVFVMTWVRYIGDLLQTLYYKINWAEENRSLYLDLHNIADPLYNDQIFPRNWLQSISYQTGYFVLVFVKHVVRVREHLRTPRLIHFFFLSVIIALCYKCHKRHATYDISSLYRASLQQNPPHTSSRHYWARDSHTLESSAAGRLHMWRSMLAMRSTLTSYHLLFRNITSNIC